MKSAPVLIALSFLCVAGCTLPGEGPSTDDVMHAVSAPADQSQYSLIEIDTGIVGILATEPARDGSDEAPLRAARPIGLLGPGDLLSVSEWETVPGMASAASAGGADKPAIGVTTRIDQSGGIALPFVGRVAAAGRTPAELENALLSRLRTQTINPQVSVLVMEDQTNSVILAGELGRPGRQNLTHGARRVLDLLALAGGSRIPADKAVVRVERGGVSWSRPLGRILADPALNILLGPGDRVTVLPLNRRFYAFGAVNAPGEHEFPAETQSLIQALGRVAGLQDGRADRDGLFVFRRQNEALTSEMLAGKAPPRPNVVYHLDMKNPAAFFLASGFQIRPEDVLFVSNSPVADFSKVLNLVTGLGMVAATPRNFGVAP